MRPAAAFARDDNASISEFERDLRVDVMPHPHLAVDRQHHAARIEHAPRQREIGIGQDDAEQQQRIRLLDQSGDRRVARRAQIGADGDVAGVLQQAAAHEGRHHRDLELARQRRDRVLDAVAAHLDVDDDRRLLRRG